jgi:hypothetical protein
VNREVRLCPAVPLTRCDEERRGINVAPHLARMQLELLLLLLLLSPVMPVLMHAHAP